MEALSLVLGIIGIVVSAFGLLYAFLAAQHSESLLRRLVVYPFRELDIAFARLNVFEQQAVHELFTATNGGKTPITEELLRKLTSSVREFGPEMLAFLESERWLQRSSDDLLRINSDRIPYINFLRENEMEKRRHGFG